MYKAKKGMQDVAVKTFHSRFVSPHVPVSEAANNIDRVSTPPVLLACQLASAFAVCNERMCSLISVADNVCL